MTSGKDMIFIGIDILGIRLMSPLHLTTLTKKGKMFEMINGTGIIFYLNRDWTRTFLVFVRIHKVRVSPQFLKYNLPLMDVRTYGYHKSHNVGKVINIQLGRLLYNNNNTMNIVKTSLNLRASSW